jgi:hypothetical protein
MTPPPPLAPMPRLDGTEPCRWPGVDPEWFFPDESDAVAVARARGYCRTCPRITACLAWALEADETGIWAATTTAQRQQLRDDFGITSRAISAWDFLNEKDTHR